MGRLDLLARVVQLDQSDILDRTVQLDKQVFMVISDTQEKLVLLDLQDQLG